MPTEVNMVVGSLWTVAHGCEILCGCVIQMGISKEAEMRYLVFLIQVYYFKIFIYIVIESVKCQKTISKRPFFVGSCFSCVYLTECMLSVVDCLQRMLFSQKKKQELHKNIWTLYVKLNIDKRKIRKLQEHKSNNQ